MHNNNVNKSIIKNNECMTYLIRKVLSNVKYQYFSFVNVATMPSIDSNNLKMLYLSLYVMNNQSEIETGVRLRQICSLNLRRSTVYNTFMRHYNVHLGYKANHHVNRLLQS